MKKLALRITLVILVMAGLGAGVGWYLFREPQFNGKTGSEWLEQMKSSDVARRMEAEGALMAMGEEGLPFLLGKATGMQSRARTNGKKMAEKLPRPIYNGLRRLFGSADGDMTRAVALQAIRSLGTNGAAAVPTLTNILRDPSSQISYQAAITLQVLPGAVPGLVEALDDGNYQVRANACVALQGQRELASNAAPRLVRILNEETGPMVGSAAYTLSCIGEPAIGVLTNSLKGTNANLRHWAAYALGSMDARGLPAVPALCEAAKDGDVTVRTAVVAALRKIDRITPEADGVLVAALSDSYPPVQMEAMEALVFRPRAVRGYRAEIEKVLDHPNEKMRKLAREALERWPERKSERALP